ncbi:MAG: hypothetical protein JWM17_2429, partial [Actinobacteria bacterium]|nr:hypothetical protein [Actinomycetota bacterium]
MARLPAAAAREQQGGQSECEGDREAHNHGRATHPRPKVILMGFSARRAAMVLLLPVVAA